MRIGRRHALSALTRFFIFLSAVRRYVVTFDGAASLSAGKALTLSCAGSANGCGCVDVTGATSGPRAVGCGKANSAENTASTSAEFESSACLVQAAVELETLRSGGATVVNGGGALSFSGGGQYFLPSTVSADVEVTDGAEVVCPQWAAELVGAVNVSSGGVLWFAGIDGWGNMMRISMWYVKTVCPTCTVSPSPPPYFWRAT